MQQFQMYLFIKNKIITIKNTPEVINCTLICVVIAYKSLALSMLCAKCTENKYDNASLFYH